MRPIAHAEDELQTYQQDTNIPKDDEDVFSNIVTEWVDSLVRERASNEVESEIEVGEREEGEEEGYKLVEEFDVEEDFARDGVVGLPDLFEVDKGVHSREEGSIQPSSSL